ncbi:MAG: aspartate-semialdehyde dehydrogenase [Rhodothermales bacterium]
MKLTVCILGATGAVGQKFVRLLEDHPWFTVTAVAASERSAGKRYRDAAHWIEPTPMPEGVADLEVQLCEPGLDCDLVFSGLDSSVAGTVEKAFASAGYPVISNAKNHRMDDDVPLLIPEVNPDHVDLIHRQTYSDSGFIVTNPNCATVGLTMALKPLQDAFGIEAVHVTTMQALSGAGYPGVASLDAVANVVPYIGGEEDKLETEPLRILATRTGEGPHSSVTSLSIPISAQCNRVPVIDGHMECVSVKLVGSPSLVAIEKAIRGFTSPDEISVLPSSPASCLEVDHSDSAPQPRRDVHRGDGMTVSVGRVRSCPVFDARFVVLSHNTIRGAAGGAILNAELLAARGLLPRRLA